MTKNPIIIYGPTQTGKTDLGIKLAKKYDGEIISADSRQVYKGLDIGSGKVDFQSNVKKHEGYWIVNDVKINGFDLVKPGDEFSVADFLKFSTATTIQIIRKKKLPILVGGTGFYLKALIDGIDMTGTPKNHVLRLALEKQTTDSLYQKLFKLNPQKAVSLNESDRKNPRRLIRAIEISLDQKQDTPSVNSSQPAGLTFDKLSKPRGFIQQKNNYTILGLTAPNDFLYERADKWLETRLENGLIDEVKGLIENEVKAKWLDDLGLEYRWITRLIEDSITKEAAIKRLKGGIHSYIRRQKTWFKKFENIKIFDISEENYMDEIENEIKTKIAPHPKAELYSE